MYNVYVLSTHLGKLLLLASYLLNWHTVNNIIIVLNLIESLNWENDVAPYVSSTAHRFQPTEPVQTHQLDLGHCIYVAQYCRWLQLEAPH